MPLSGAGQCWTIPGGVLARLQDIPVDGSQRPSPCWLVVDQAGVRWGTAEDLRLAGIPLADADLRRGTLTPQLEAMARHIARSHLVPRPAGDA
jgi:hypothetical protein